MSAFTDFQNSLEAARRLTAMYVELRGYRGLGRRGALDAANRDLLWLPRSAVVAAVSAMDAYVHAVLDDQVPIALRANPMPDALCAAMADLVPIRNAQNFRDAYSLIATRDPAQTLSTELGVRTLQFAAYQQPDKIIAGYSLIGRANIFVEVANTWPGPGTTDELIKRRLANYVRRRNQIAHEGDREAGGAVRPMQPQYASGCTEFVDNLVTRFNRIVYGVP